MTEFDIKQDKDPELVEKEFTDVEPVGTEFDLPEYEPSLFEMAEDVEEDDEEEEDGEPE